jgi:hypothetical protein
MFAPKLKCTRATELHPRLCSDLVFFREYDTIRVVKPLAASPSFEPANSLKGEESRHTFQRDDCAAVRIAAR